LSASTNVYSRRLENLQETLKAFHQRGSAFKGLINKLIQTELVNTLPSQNFLSKGAPLVINLFEGDILAGVFRINFKGGGSSGLQDVGALGT
jgi:hypothetical protein